MDHNTETGGSKAPPMIRLHKNVIRATDVAAQFWCERQMELGYIYGREATPEMKSGTEAHKNIEVIMNIPVKLRPESYTDSLYKSLYASYLGISTLPERGVARELNIYGSANGFKMAGKIDEVRYEDGKIVVYEDKMKMSDKEPSRAQIASHQVQVLLYVKMLNDIKSGSYTFANFSRGWGTGRMKTTDSFNTQLKEIGMSERDMTVDAIAADYFSSLMKSGSVSGSAFIRYTNARSGNIIKSYRVEYSQKDFVEKLNYAMVYWNGLRDAKPVDEDEKWKCNYCQFFGKQCTVWYKEKQTVL